MKAHLNQARVFDAALSFHKFSNTKYYQNEPKLNRVYPRNKRPEIKDGEYLINLDKYKSIETHRIALYVNGNNPVYFDSFGVEHIS